MDEKVLEIQEYRSEGYRPLIYFNGWRVAILRWIEDTLPEKITSMERHTQTDEVFVLLEGQATLILGGNGPVVTRLQRQVMENCILYNVRQNAWHTVVLSRDASILIVENQNTGEVNSEYFALSEEQKMEIRRMGEYR
jgi:ureidoglycolate hydrolase